MAGGKEQKNANKMITGGGKFEEGQRDQFEARNEQDMIESRGRGDDLYNKMYSGYSSLSEGGGGGGGGGGGSTSVPKDARFGEVEGVHRDFMKTGGWDDARRSSMNENIGRMKSIGYDPESVNRMRGGGVFDEFAKTGGYSEGDRQNIRDRANSQVPAMFGRIRDEGNRQAVVQGGYGPGRMAMMGRMGRDQAAAAGDVSLNAETGIMDRVNQGRQWGGSAMAEAEQGLGDIRLRSTGGAADLENRMGDSINQGRQYGTSGLQSLAEGDRQAQMQVDAQNASAGRWASEFGLRQKLEGIEGLRSLYGSVPAEYTTNKSFDLENRGLSSGAIGQLGSQLKTGNKSWYDPLVGIAAGAAGAML